MIEEHSREMKDRKNIEKNRYLENLPLSIKWKMNGENYISPYKRNSVVLDINTSEKTRIKAYKFMNTFINGISEIDGRIYVEKMEANDNTIFSLLQSKYKCKLYEKQAKLRNNLNISEIKMQPLYSLKYTGDLCFEIYEKTKNDSWNLLQNIDICDSEIIENKFIDIFSKLRNDAISKKNITDKENIRQQEKLKEKIKLVEEEKTREEQIRIEKEKMMNKQKIQKEIESHIEKWNNMNKVLTYVEELRSMLYNNLNEKNLILKYCDYVEKIYNKSKFYEEILKFSKNI